MHTPIALSGREVQPGAERGDRRRRAKLNWGSMINKCMRILNMSVSSRHTERLRKKRRVEGPKRGRGLTKSVRRRILEMSMFVSVCEF